MLENIQICVYDRQQTTDERNNPTKSHFSNTVTVHFQEASEHLVRLPSAMVTHPWSAGINFPRAPKLERL
jgi:hypothetical protein